MSEWIKVLEFLPKPGTMTEVEVNGKALLIAKFDNQLYCAENRCPHEDIKLSLGCLKAGRVQCSLHGYSFDLATGQSSDVDVESMQTYPVKVENNCIFIEI